MFGTFGWMELLLILFIVLIVFGAGKIPQLGEGLGKAIKGFKKSINEDDAMNITPPQEDLKETPSQIKEPPVTHAPAEGNRTHVSVGVSTQKTGQESSPPPPPPIPQG